MGVYPDMSRCPESLEVHLPPADQHVDETVVLQCVREPEHKGLHKTDAQSIPWRTDTPKGKR